MKHLIPFLLLSVFTLTLFAQEIKLPVPQQKGGMPLMDALSKRESTREFSTKDIDQQTLSNLLWAGWGFNRSGKRTAPSARNFQEIDIYVVKADGVFLYNAKSQSLMKLLGEDLRSLTGTQDFVGKAPLNLVYVADLKKAQNKDFNQEPVWSYANAGFIAQNIYLYCASVNLGCVIRGLIPKDALAQKLNLQPHQKIILAQTIGRVKESK